MKIAEIDHKVFRDPIHGYINVHKQVIWDCINCKEFQRLRRIKQLGASYQVYPTAEHSRFSHSLGVYEVTRRMITEIVDLDNALDDRQKIVVLLAALLHDVGHGPFSHSFEAISKIDHEEYTEMIILGDSEINAVLVNAGEGLAQEIADVIAHRYPEGHPNELLSQIISSQLDADRMDYLLRDAYFTGTSYGSFEINRILRTMKVIDNKIVVKESGIHAVEDYIMARYHMYWNVYLHPVSRSYEGILGALFARLNQLRHTVELDRYPLFKEFLNEDKPNIHSHFNLDEATCLYYFNLMQNGADPILADLARRLLNRDLFAYHDRTSQKHEEEIRKKLNDHNYDPQYYLYVDKLTQNPYSPYKKSDTSLINILTNDEEVKELSLVSDIVAAIAAGKNKSEEKIFFPKEIL